jgi:hypothetical protein
MEASQAGPFVYSDTASSRAEIESVSERLAGGTIMIIGCGGTGSYVLDLLAKTPVDKIILVDGDVMEQHNAFRAPGAPSLKEVSAGTKKVDYFANIYSKMHARIEPVDTYLAVDNLTLLDGVDFAFVCVDTLDARTFLIPALQEREIPFIDAGLGLELAGDAILGQIRVTTSTSKQGAHCQSRIPAAAGDSEIYRSNLQIADMNALAAALAVIRYKRLRGFYVDSEGEYNSIYVVDGNDVINTDHSAQLAV